MFQPRKLAGFHRGDIIRRQELIALVLLHLVDRAELFQPRQSEAVYKVPLLGDIPLLGWLFKKKTMTRNRMELLIFVTPRIMEN